MPFPRGGDDDAIRLLLFEKVLPGIWAAGIDLRHFLAGFGDDVFCAGQHIVIDISNSDEVYVIASQQERQVVLSAEAGADDGHPDFG